jgi:hypothetical protein
MPPPLPYFKVNICPLPLPHFASIFFAYLWFFRWPMHSEFSRPAMCNNAIMIISSQM